MTPPKTREEVMKEIEDAGEIVPSDFVYKKDWEDTSVICSKCKQEYIVSRNNFVFQGSRCPPCSRAARSAKKKFSLRELNDRIELKGCKLLSDYGKYSNSKCILSFKCSCGIQFRTSFTRFQQGRRCKSCGIVKESYVVDKPEDEDDQKAHFIRESEEKYGNRYSYNIEEFHGLRSYDKMTFTCLIHDMTFIQDPYNYLQLGQIQCKKCYKKKSTRRTEMITIIEEKFGKEAFDFSLIPKTANTATKLELICLTCKTRFSRNPSDILYKVSHGCPKCSLEGKKIGKEEFVRIN